MVRCTRPTFKAYAENEFYHFNWSSDQIKFTITIDNEGVHNLNGVAHHGKSAVACFSHACLRPSMAPHVFTQKDCRGRGISLEPFQYTFAHLLLSDTLKRFRLCLVLVMQGNRPGRAESRVGGWWGEVALKEHSLRAVWKITGRAKRMSTHPPNGPAFLFFLQTAKRDWLGTRGAVGRQCRGWKAHSCLPGPWLRRPVGYGQPNAETRGELWHGGGQHRHWLRQLHLPRKGALLGGLWKQPDTITFLTIPTRLVLSCLWWVTYKFQQKSKKIPSGTDVTFKWFHLRWSCSDASYHKPVIHHWAFYTTLSAHEFAYIMSTVQYLYNGCMCSLPLRHVRESFYLIVVPIIMTICWISCI